MSAATVGERANLPYPPNIKLLLLFEDDRAWVERDEAFQSCLRKILITSKRESFNLLPATEILFHWPIGN